MEWMCMVAIRLESIARNLTDDTIRNTLAENWDGKLPAIVGQGNMAGIMDIGGILNDQQGSDSND